MKKFKQILLITVASLLAIPTSLLSMWAFSPLALAATTGSGGGSASYVGQSSYVTLNNLVLTSSGIGDINLLLGINIIVKDSAENPDTMLQFDTSQPITVLTVGAVVATTPITPLANSITIPITVGSGAGDTVTISNIRVRATAGSIMGDDHLSVTTAGGVVSGSAIHIDVTAPILTFTSPIDGAMINTATPTLTFSATDNSAMTYQVNVDNSSWTNMVPGGTIGPLGEGDHAIALKAIDAAGNESAAVTHKIYYQTGLKTTPDVFFLAANTQNATIDDTANNGLSIGGVNTNAATTVSVASYADNPGKVGLIGLGAFKGYQEIRLSNNTAFNFPVTVRIYFTQADLNAAGITKDKLYGLYYYDRAGVVWRNYARSGVDTTPVVLNGQSYLGFVWADVDHLTPIAVAYDNSAPAAPANLKVNRAINQVTLSWTAIPDANSYVVKYSVADAEEKLVTTLTLDKSTTSLAINQLAGGIAYEFSVVAIDSVGNISTASSIQATPLVKPTLFVPVAVAESAPSVSAPSENPITTPTVTAPSENNKIQAGEPAQAKNQSYTALAILLIALGAGVGGYYLYEWWTTNRLLPPEKPKRPAPKKSTTLHTRRSNRTKRW